jgi:hypothetical protein
MPDELVYLGPQKYIVENVAPINGSSNQTKYYREVLTSKTAITFQRMIETFLVIREAKPKPSL